MTALPCYPMWALKNGLARGDVLMSSDRSTDDRPAHGAAALLRAPFKILKILKLKNFNNFGCEDFKIWNFLKFQILRLMTL